MAMTPDKRPRSFKWSSLLGYWQTRSRASYIPLLHKMTTAAC